MQRCEQHRAALELPEKFNYDYLFTRVPVGAMLDSDNPLRWAGAEIHLLNMERFEEAAEKIKAIDAKKTSNDEKLVRKTFLFPCGVIVYIIRASYTKKENIREQTFV